MRCACFGFGVALIVLAFSMPVVGGPFEDKVTASGMMFAKPDGYEAVALTPNSDVQYDYALHHPTEKYEVRYAIQPISKERVEEFQKWESSKDKGDTVLTDPNRGFAAKFSVIAFNIAGKPDNIGPVQHFPPESAKKEFNADDGMVVPMEIESGFGKGFKACLLVGIHKNDVADAFIFYLFDDPEQMKKGQNTVFYALKFADEKK